MMKKGSSGWGMGRWIINVGPYRQGIEGGVMGPPRGSDMYTSEELSRLGVVGVYEKVDEEEKTRREEGLGEWLTNTQYHDWCDVGIVFGPPKGGDKYTSEELSQMGMREIYRRVKEKEVTVEEMRGYFKWDESGGAPALTLAKPFPEDMSDRLAIRLSGTKWGLMLVRQVGCEEVARGRGSATCALCVKYTISGPRPLLPSTDCKECPIGRKTGEQGCRGTPWIEYHDATTPGEALVAQAKMVRFLDKLYEGVGLEEVER